MTITVIVTVENEGTVREYPKNIENDKGTTFNETVSRKGERNTVRFRNFLKNKFYICQLRTTYNKS